MENSLSKQVNRYIFLAIILIFAFFLFASLRQFFPAFLGAITFYILSQPFATWLVKKKGWNKGLTAILIIIISFFVILLPVATLISLLYNKISAVLANPDIITGSIKQADSIIHQKYHISLISNDTLATIRAKASELLSVLLNKSLGFVSTILMMYFFLYFMIVNTNRLEAAIILYLPFKKDKIQLFGNELVHQTFSNAIGVPAIAVAQGLAGFLGYWITGMSEPGFWGVITAFTSFIPVVGTGIAWAPIAVYMFIIGHYWQGIFMLLYGAIIMGLLDNVIRFILAKKMADVHPIITVLGVILGLQYFGILGLIFGPLLISYFFILLKIYYVEYQKPVARQLKKRQIVPAYMQPFIGLKKPKDKPGCTS
ncbi:AI-2E family transporter [Parafilimonas sp.]|uniref:AI-2E family transporter n=1 Tax=Parafilimonas sp. TaxID=1969739 RepID=UPI0039E4FA1F